LRQKNQFSFLFKAKFGAWIPLAIIGVLCLSAAFFASFLPETLNEYLPQSAKDSAEFGSQKPYWSLASPKKPNEKVEANFTGPIPVIKIELESMATSSSSNDAGREQNGHVASV